jgi:integrase
MTTVDPIRNKNDICKIKRVLLESNYRDYLLFEVGINTGLRISDILKLKVSDIRGKYYIELKEQKTGKLKKFRMNSVLKQELDNYISSKNEDNYLFESLRTSGNPLERTRAYCILNKAAKTAKLKLKMGTHTMRKTFGFHFYKQTKDIALLQVLFNHSSPSVTLRYIGIDQNILDNAMEKFVL